MLFLGRGGAQGARNELSGNATTSSTSNVEDDVLISMQGDVRLLAQHTRARVRNNLLLKAKKNNVFNILMRFYVKGLGCVGCCCDHYTITSKCCFFILTFYWNGNQESYYMTVVVFFRLVRERVNGTHAVRATRLLSLFAVISCAVIGLVSNAITLFFYKKNH